VGTGISALGSRVPPLTGFCGKKRKNVLILSKLLLHALPNGLERKMMSLRIKKVQSKTALWFYLIMISGRTLFADFGTFQIAEEPTGPRSAAMGSAGTAVPGGNFGFYNPASPAFAQAPFLAVEYGGEPGDLSKSKIETAWMFSKWFAGASLQVRSIDWQMANEQGPGAMSSNQAVLATINGGFILGRFASGHSINLINERIGNRNYRVFTYCPGLMYRLLPDKLTIGASLLHYLRVDTVGGAWYKAPSVWYRSARGYLPRYARAGISWSDTLHDWSLPFTAACDVVYSDIYERLMVPLGVEAWVLPYLAARAGIRINHRADIVHFGIGIRWNSLEFDFDYGSSKPPVSGADIETKWLFGLTYSLHNPAKGPLPKPAPGKSAATPAVPDTSNISGKKDLSPQPVKDTITILPSDPDAVPADTAVGRSSVKVDSLVAPEQTPDSLNLQKKDTQKGAR
jgi:hypothetical protein